MHISIGEAGRKIYTFGIPLGLDGLRFRILRINHLPVGGGRTRSSLNRGGAVINHKIDGGEAGIRTLETLRFTRFPSERTRPGYATSPK